MLLVRTPSCLQTPVRRDESQAFSLPVLLGKARGPGAGAAETGSGGERGVGALQVERSSVSVQRVSFQERRWLVNLVRPAGCS